VKDNIYKHLKIYWFLMFFSFPHVFLDLLKKDGGNALKVVK